MPKPNIFKLFFLVVSVVLLSSCGTKKNMHHSADVSSLSEKLKIPIKTDDPQLPLLVESSTWLGVPHKAGGTTKAGADCSGFVWQVYKKTYEKQLERASYQMADKNVTKVNQKSLKTGDLVFFKTTKNSNKISHVGIYLRNGYFIHVSTSKGVIVSHLDENYYKQAWVKGGRIK